MHDVWITDAVAALYHAGLIHRIGDALVFGARGYRFKRLAPSETNLCQMISRP